MNKQLTELRSPAFPENDVLKKIEIKYPVDKAYRTFLYNGRTHELFEMIKFKENFRSWFVGDYVYQGNDHNYDLL